MTGPRSAQPGYDYILQGLTGWMSLTGEPDGPPAKTGLSLVDYAGGLAAAIALLAGVHAARRDGVGTDCDVSLFDVATVLLSYPAVWHLTGGYEPGRTRNSAHPSLVPFQCFPTADGWIVVACPKEKFWQRLAGLLAPHLPPGADLAADPRFDTFATRNDHREDLLEILETVFRTRPSAAWLADLEAAGIPSGPVNDVAAALADPHTAARDLVVETEHPRFGTVRQPGALAKVGPEPPVCRRAPRRNEDAPEILRGLLGYSEERVRELEAEGALG